MTDSYTSMLTKGIELGEDYARHVAWEYIEGLCQRIMAMDDIEQIRQHCAETIEVNRAAKIEKESEG